MKKFSSPTQKIGELGEDIAIRFLEGRGHTTLERNYTQKWGEIDVITQKKKVVHFIEVKSMSFVAHGGVSHETDALRPEDHMDKNKQKRLKRTIETYLVSHKVREWCFDLVCVYVDQNSKKAHVKVMEDLIL